MTPRLIGCLLAALAVSGCGGTAAPEKPPQTVQRHVAERFADAVLRGDAAGARALLARPDEAALVYLVRRAAAPWTNQHGSIRVPARHTDGGWAFSYFGTRAHRDGTFEREKGELVVLVEPSATGAAVRFFAFKHVRTRFSTHHDALLPPSKR